jgi:hypothetical protein
MPTGIVSGAWGYSPQNVAGMKNSAEFGDQPLTYQLGLTSVPPTFSKESGEMVSPLTVANKGYYSKQPGFGKRKTNDVVYLKKQLKKK